MPQWLAASLIGVGVFLLTQAGVLIAILARIRTELNHINKAMRCGSIRFESNETAVDAIERRLDILETRYNSDKVPALRAQLTELKEHCIEIHGSVRGRRGKS